MKARATALLTATCLVAGLAACATAASPSPGAADGTTVGVTLQEWAVVPDAASAPAGTITFDVTNQGPNDVHEFVIVRTDLGVTDLPTDETGTVDESGQGIEVVDEIEDVAVGASESLVVNLEAGSYVLICNIYSADEDEAHYAMGMATGFTVEGN